MQIPHHTKEYCQEHKLAHLTAAEAAAQMIRELPISEGAKVVVLEDTAMELKSTMGFDQYCSQDLTR